MRQEAKPWEAVGMSRTVWYRRGKPTQKPEPRRGPHAIIAEHAAELGVSVRTIQRDRAKAIRRAWAEVDKEGRGDDLEQALKLFNAFFLAKLAERAEVIVNAIKANQRHRYEGRLSSLKSA